MLFLNYFFCVMYLSKRFIKVEQTVRGPAADLANGTIHSNRIHQEEHETIESIVVVLVVVK